MRSLFHGIVVRLFGAVLFVSTILGSARPAGSAENALLLKFERAGSIDGPWIPLGEFYAPGGSGSGLVRLRLGADGVIPLPTHFVWIPPGRYVMGTPTTEVQRRTNEGPQTRMGMSRGFWMSRYEVTQAEFESVMGFNGSFFTGADLPADQVSWEEAIGYCQKLTLRERAAGRLPEGLVFRLPTDAEWEYACRAGTTNATSFGDKLSSTQANFDGTKPYNGADKGPDLGSTTKVGSYPPNAWGLHDMHGNVSEWVSDWTTGGLPGGSMSDLIEVSTPTVTPFRIHRGGAWHSEGAQCRSGARSTVTRLLRVLSSGFRPVLAPTP